MKKSNFYYKKENKFYPIPKIKSKEEALEYINALKVIHNNKKNYNLFSHTEMIDYLEKKKQDEIDKLNELVKNLHPKAIDVCKYLSYENSDFEDILEIFMQKKVKNLNFSEIEERIIDLDLNAKLTEDIKYYAYCYWDVGSNGKFCNLNSLEEIYQEQQSSYSGEEFEITVLDISGEIIKKVTPKVTVSVKI